MTDDQRNALTHPVAARGMTMDEVAQLLRRLAAADLPSCCVLELLVEMGVARGPTDAELLAEAREDLARLLVLLKLVEQDASIALPPRLRSEIKGELSRRRP